MVVVDDWRKHGPPSGPNPGFPQNARPAGRGGRHPATKPTKTRVFAGKRARSYIVDRDRDQASAYQLRHEARRRAGSHPDAAARPVKRSSSTPSPSSAVRHIRWIVDDRMPSFSGVAGVSSPDRVAHGPLSAHGGCLPERMRMPSKFGQSRSALPEALRWER